MNQKVVQAQTGHMNGLNTDISKAHLKVVHRARLVGCLHSMRKAWDSIFSTAETGYSGASLPSQTLGDGGRRILDVQRHKVVNGIMGKGFDRNINLQPLRDAAKQHL